MLRTIARVIVFVILLSKVCTYTNIDDRVARTLAPNNANSAKLVVVMWRDGTVLARVVSIIISVCTASVESNRVTVAFEKIT